MKESFQIIRSNPFTTKWVSEKVHCSWRLPAPGPLHPLVHATSLPFGALASPLPTALRATPHTHTLPRILPGVPAAHPSSPRREGMWDKDKSTSPWGTAPRVKVWSGAGRPCMGSLRHRAGTALRPHLGHDGTGQAPLFSIRQAPGEGSTPSQLGALGQSPG